MAESGVFVPEDGDIVHLKAEGERHARMGWVNVGPHAVQLILDRDGNLTIEAHPRTQEGGAPLQSVSVSHQQAVDAGGVDPDCNWPMTDPEKLLAHLVSKYPALEPHFVDKSTTAYADDPAMPPQLIAIVVKDNEIVDPYTSECGRFQVSPGEAYGISDEDALYIKAINCPEAMGETPPEDEHPGWFGFTEGG